MVTHFVAHQGSEESSRIKLHLHWTYEAEDVRI